MESSSIAYLFKHLSLRDWLIYCERNGMPGVKGVTQARPGSKEWDMACDAVKNFSAEFCAVMSHGTDIQAIDISGKGVLPYPEFVKRIDDLMYLTWLGTRLINSSKENPTGVTLQRNENNILEEEDAQRISETLNEQVDREVLSRLEGIKQPKAYFRLKSSSNKNLNNDLAIIKTLYDMGVSLSVNDIREHFGINPPLDIKDTLQKWGVHPVAESEEGLQK
jgi:phage gp29-like protein